MFKMEQIVSKLDHINATLTNIWDALRNDYRSIVNIYHPDRDDSQPNHVGIDVNAIVWYQFHPTQVLKVELVTGRMVTFYGPEAAFLLTLIGHDRQRHQIEVMDKKKGVDDGLDIAELDHDPDL